MARFSMKFLQAIPIGQFKPYIGLEDDFQISAANYLNLRGLFWIHPANERKTKQYELKNGKKFSPEGNLLKRKGVKKGAVDCLIFEPRKGFAGFFIELKVGDNKPSDDQILFLENAKKRGYKTLITWSLEEFIFEIDKYLS